VYSTYGDKGEGEEKENPWDKVITDFYGQYTDTATNTPRSDFNPVLAADWVRDQFGEMLSYEEMDQIMTELR
jgi:hypothetical protein